MRGKFHTPELEALGSLPTDGGAEWLARAEDGIVFLEENSHASEVVIFAVFPAVLINAVLAPRDKCSPPNWDDLQRTFPTYDAGWSIEHSSGGGGPPQVRLAPPLSEWGNDVLDGGERLVFRRRFECVESEYRTELSQQFVQALDVHYVPEFKAFCRLDQHGEIEPVIRIRDVAVTSDQNAQIVSVLASELHRYMAVTNTVLVRFFDFTRFKSGSFSGWSGKNRYDRAGKDIRYHGDIQPDASYAHGVQLIWPNRTKEDVIKAFESEWNGEGKQYATFIAQDWKNECIKEISCAPDALASYFEKDSPLPFQTTPAFFRAEVLNKYRLDPDRYTIEQRSVSCRGSWYLKSYDVNEAGQVHAFLCDLARLPYSEQLYWKSFNEEPQGPISARSFKTDFLGSWDTDRDPLRDLKGQVSELDRVTPSWWSRRNETLHQAVQYPLTASSEIWASQLLALDQLLVEGFRVAGLRDILSAGGGQFEQQWGSLKLVESCLVQGGLTTEQASDIVAPLKLLHSLRSQTKGHAATSQKNALVVAAVSTHGSLKEHFRSLVDACDTALRAISDHLSG